MSIKTFFVLIPSFTLLNWFRTNSIWCHNACSIILRSHNSLFLILIGRMHNLRIAFIILKNFFLAWNEKFFQAICSQNTYIRVAFERTPINQLKWVEKFINRKKHWLQIAIRISWQDMNDVKYNSSIKSKIGNNILFATSSTFINSEVKKVSKWQLGPPYLVFKAHWVHSYWLFQKGSISTKILHHAFVFITLFIPDAMSLEIFPKFVKLLW